MDQHTHAAIAVGNFDGVHIGHVDLFNQLLNYSKKNDLASTVITFEKHTSNLLNPESPTPQIYPRDTNFKLLQEFGFDHCHSLIFDIQMRALTALEFLTKLKNEFKLKALFLGKNASIGSDRLNFSSLLEVAKSLNIDVFGLDLHQGLYDKVISSSMVRSFLKEGSIKSATELLGRTYALKGSVIPGQGKGRVIGYPTINILLDMKPLLPLGVYEVNLYLSGKPRKGIANFGYAPTLANRDNPILEVHILNWEDNIVIESHCEVAFHSFIRPEKRFAQVSDLIQQIEQDIKYIF